MEHVLHTYVRERLKGYLDADAHTGLDDLRRMTMEMAEGLKAEETAAIVEQLVATAGASGLAVTGFKKTLEALNMAAVSTLVLRDDAASKGVICNKCGFLGLRRADCRRCGKGMTAVEDIVEPAVETATAHGAVVRRIKADSPLDGLGGIGAFLRFPLKG